MNKWLFKIFLFLLLISFQFGYGGTVLSSRLIGSPYHFPNSRSMGMGGLAIANPDPNSINSVNPADLTAIQKTTLSLQYLYEYNHYQDHENWNSSDYSNFHGFGFGIPLGREFGFAIGLSPLTRLDYNLKFNNTIGEQNYTKSLEGIGGLNRFTGTGAWKPHTMLSLGFSIHYLFGEIQESGLVNYSGNDFYSSADQYTIHQNGFCFSFGLLHQPISNFILGGYFSPSTSLDTRSVLSTTFSDSDDKTDGSVTYPGSWGIGITWLIQAKGQLGFELEQKNWSNLQINGQTLPEAQNTLRFGLGGQLLISRDPLSPYLHRIAYRIGFNYNPYASSDLEGEQINEIWGTFGLGLPFFFNNAQLDLAVGIGKRGSLKTNGISENLMRFTISLSGGERWFISRY